MCILLLLPRHLLRGKEKILVYFCHYAPTLYFSFNVFLTTTHHHLSISFYTLFIFVDKIPNISYNSFLFSPLFTPTLHPCFFVNHVTLLCCSSSISFFAKYEQVVSLLFVLYFSLLPAGGYTNVKQSLQSQPNTLCRFAVPPSHWAP